MIFILKEPDRQDITDYFYHHIVDKKKNEREVTNDNEESERQYVRDLEIKRLTKRQPETEKEMWAGKRKSETALCR